MTEQDKVVAALHQLELDLGDIEGDTDQHVPEDEMRELVLDVEGALFRVRRFIKRNWTE